MSTQCTFVRKFQLFSSFILLLSSSHSRSEASDVPAFFSLCACINGVSVYCSQKKKNSMGQHLRWIMPDRMLPQTKEMHFLELCRKEEGKIKFRAMSLLLSTFCGFCYSIAVWALVEHRFPLTHLALVCQLFVLWFEQLEQLVCSRLLLPKSCPPLLWCNAQYC